jgi:thioredoxin-like negative regulator of GroEL
MELIDAFLDTLPAASFSLEAEEAAAVDYVSAYLSEKEDVADSSPKMRGQELIDKFLEGDEEKITLSLSDEDEPAADLQQSAKPVAASGAKEAETPTFTETLANIYLKQGKYDKALEILKRINLEYPNKNRYFADQIRFLEKIVKHTKRK